MSQETARPPARTIAEEVRSREVEMDEEGPDDQAREQEELEDYLQRMAGSGPPGPTGPRDREEEQEDTKWHKLSKKAFDPKNPPDWVHPVQHVEEPTPIHLGEEWRSDLQEEFNPFDWGHPRGKRYSIKFKRVPEQLGLMAKNNRRGRYSTEYKYGVTVFRALRWYLEQLQWVSQRGDSAGTTRVDLAIDFEQAAAVPLQTPHHPRDELNLQREATFMSNAARRLARICGLPGPHPGPPKEHCGSLTALRYPRAAGVARPLSPWYRGRSKKR